MRGFRALGLAAAALLGGCVAQANTTAEDAPVWGRMDCQRATGNAVVQAEADQARQICTSRAEAAAVAGTANMPGGRGIGGAMVAGINQGITSGQIRVATAASCMGEMGYILKTRAQHLAMCDAIADQQRQRATTKR